MQKRFQKGKISIWLVIILVAVLAVVLAEVLLIFNFWEITKKEIPAMKENTELQSASYVLDKFMEARVAGKKDQAVTYFTENAMEQYSKNEFSLTDGFKSFEALKNEKLEDLEDSYLSGFRFIVKIKEENEMDYFLEAVTLVKISDRYFVHSIEIPG